MQDEAIWIKRVRYFVAFGLLAYLTSFYVLGPSAQKTIFYLLVAAPCLCLLADFRKLAVGNYKKSILLVGVFIFYIALSSTWSQTGDLIMGLKLALCIACLMIAIFSTLRILGSQSQLIRHLVILVGFCAVFFYSTILVNKFYATGEIAPILLTRLSLKSLSGIGDSNPINTAIYLGVTVLACWWTIPYVSAQKKLALLLLASSSIALLFLTQSRGPFLSLAVVILLVTVVRRHKNDLFLFAAGLIACTFIVLYFDLGAMIVNRVESPNYRAEIWSRAMNLISENLFFGQGLGSSANISFATPDQTVVTVSHSHSSIIEVFRVGGVLGGALFFGMLFLGTKDISTGIGERQFFGFWLIFGMLCLLTNGRLLVIRPSVEWFAFWIPFFFVTFIPNNSKPIR